MKNFSRIKTLIKKIGKDTYLIEDPYDLYYLLGKKFSKGTLIAGSKVALFVDGRYIEMAKECGGCDVFDEKDFFDWLKKENIHELYFDAEKTSYQRYESLLKQNSQLRLVSRYSPVKSMRAVKSIEEIEKIKKASELNARALKHLAQLFHEGVSEVEIARAYEIFCLEQGGEKMAFEPIIAFGANSAFPHHRAGRSRLKKGDSILVDVGVFVEAYASDMTRCFFFEGSNPLLVSLYENMKEFHKKLLAEIREGISISWLDQQASEWMNELGYQPKHSLGHGIGLEVHEYPRLKADKDDRICLQENMVITIEPGIYLPGVGGLRYEDTIIVKKSGIINLYEDLVVS